MVKTEMSKIPMQTKRTEKPMVKTEMSKIPMQTKRPQNPTHGTRRPKKSPQEKDVFDKHLTLDHFHEWNKYRMAEAAARTKLT